MWDDDISRDVYYEKFTTFPAKVEDGKGTILKDKIWFNDKIKEGARKIIQNIITNEINSSEIPEKLNILRNALKVSEM